ncbi:hypothetical protein [Candidatus Poriferisodalis sp.]|uniref:hypothetical protein n=1 Tax=Candidatus Poriferisodalis sp. TaxID=3101277 RepID=UPI003B52196F
MASPTSPVEPTDKEGEGLLETIGAQLATLATQISEIDQRMASVESGSPSQPVEVQLSPQTVAQIADALAALQAAGSQALDEAFKTASDDLTEALSGLVRTEISKTLTEAGYAVEVSEAAPALPAIVAPLATSPADAAEQPDAHHDVVDVGPIREADDEAEDDLDADDAADPSDSDFSADRPPLALSELDDPFLDALIRKEPLSA